MYCVLYFYQKSLSKWPFTWVYRGAITPLLLNLTVLPLKSLKAKSGTAKRIHPINQSVLLNWRLSLRLVYKERTQTVPGLSREKGHDGLLWT